MGGSVLWEEQVDEADGAPGQSVLFFWPLRKAAGLVAQGARGGAGRALAPLGGWSGPARRSDRPLARDPRHPRRLAGLSFCPCPRPSDRGRGGVASSRHPGPTPPLGVFL